ncbi:MAG: hypothetical protein H6766_02020 [Candidatus Peribacteria bacterium]|nr:MAG: hypothetical protein H6766_02020 [Candidatus Peribacteria bacterium]
MLEQLDLTNKSDEELQKIITDFTSQIDSIDSINDVSDATYLMSRAKDALVKKQHPDQKERNSIQLMKHAIIGNGNNVL